jgi:hypothetical protein
MGLPCHTDILRAPRPPDLTPVAPGPNGTTANGLTRCMSTRVLNARVDSHALDRHRDAGKSERRFVSLFAEEGFLRNGSF